MHAGAGQLIVARRGPCVRLGGPGQKATGLGRLAAALLHRLHGFSVSSGDHVLGCMKLPSSHEGSSKLTRAKTLVFISDIGLEPNLYNYCFQNPSTGIDFNTFKHTTTQEFLDGKT